MASRMAARSTTAGTPVKSCMRMRAGAKAISLSGSAVGSQPARASMSSGLTVTASSWRSMFSRRILSEYGRVGAAQYGSRSAPDVESRRKISNVRPPTARSARAPKLLWLLLWLLVAIASLLGSALGCQSGAPGPRGEKPAGGGGWGPAASEEPGVGAPGGPNDAAGRWRGWGPAASEEPGVGAPGGPNDAAGRWRGWGPAASEEPGVGAPGGPNDAAGRPGPGAAFSLTCGHGPETASHQPVPRHSAGPCASTTWADRPHARRAPSLRDVGRSVVLSGWISGEA